MAQFICESGKCSLGCGDKDKAWSTFGAVCIKDSDVIFIGFRLIWIIITSNSISLYWKCQMQCSLVSNSLCSAGCAPYGTINVATNDLANV